MRQFVVYRNRNEDTRKVYPLLLNIQSDLVADTGTRVVVPLVPVSGGRKPPSISRLTPVLEVDGKQHVLLMLLLAAVETADLGAAVSDLTSDRIAILNALDFLTNGI
ncbi:MAG: CcdB family protein [Pseudoxanthomonas sp.]